MKHKGKALLAIGIAILLHGLTAGKSDSYLRSRAVKLKSEMGSCSGEQVRAPSGQDYILTAGHCRILADKNDSIEVITESGKHLMRKVVAEDPKSDLLLLEGIPNLQGLDIARSLKRSEHVRTFTHGKGMDTYKTEGTIIQDEHLDIMIRLLEEGDDGADCKQPKNSIRNIQVFIFELKACTLSVDETITTALIVPGSSGGEVVNDKGELVGVASAIAEPFGALVRLKDIRKFLSSY